MHWGLATASLASFTHPATMQFAPAIAILDSSQRIPAGTVCSVHTTAFCCCWLSQLLLRTPSLWLWLCDWDPCSPLLLLPPCCCALPCSCEDL